MKLIIFPTWIPYSPGQLEPKNLFTFFLLPDRGEIMSGFPVGMSLPL